MSAERLRIRVTLSERGFAEGGELMLDGHKIADLSPLDVIEFATQATSTVRWFLPSNQKR